MTSLEFLYHTVWGRRILKILTARKLSQAAGIFLDSPLSVPLIAPFVRMNHIDLSVCQKRHFRNFNEFFTRELKEGERPVDMDPDILIAPCDGLLSAYEIKDDTVIPVKQSRYRIPDLLRDRELAKRFRGGTCLVFRLCVTHYHRYCYADSGVKGRNIFLPGILHTVQPIALREFPVFTENCREYTVIESPNFGSMIQMEVGAMLVGKIQNYKEYGPVTRGEQKGRFLYGGSTIILLLEKGKARISPRVFEQTAGGREIPVRMGQMIGRRAQGDK